MISRIFSDLRFRLLSLVLLTMLPAVALVLYSSGEQRRLALAGAQTDALNLARVAASQQEETIATTEQLLRIFAQFPAVKAQVQAGCSALAAGLLPHTQGLTNIGAIDANGNQFCSALPLATPISVAGQPYFERAKTERQFTLGEYQIGPVTGLPVMAATFPLLDEGGAFDGVTITGMDLSWLVRLNETIALPEGGTITVLDRNGTVVAHSGEPTPRQRIGQPYTDLPLLPAARPATGGTRTATGSDGVRYLYAFTTLDVPTSGITVVTAIPTRTAYAAVDRALTQNLIWLGTAAVLTLAAAWLGGDLIILRRTRVLLRAAAQLRHGDLTVRTGLSHRAGELGQLARAFDDMADSLQLRAEVEQAASDALKQQRDFAAQVMTAMGQGLTVTNSDGRFEFVNPAFAAMLGMAPEELLGRSPFEFTTSEDYTTQMGALDRRDAGLAGSSENRLVRPDGGTIDVMISSVPRRSGDLIDGSIAVITDLTERKKIEEAARRAEQWLRAVVTNSPVILFALDADGVYTLSEGAGLPSIGRQAGESVGRSIFDVFAGQPAVVDAVRRALDGEPVAAIVETHGRVFDARYSPTCSDQGELTGVLGVATDVTDRWRAEEAVQRSEQRFRALVQNGSDIISVIDNAGVIRYVSPSVERVLGRRPEQLTGSNIMTIIHPEDEDLARQRFQPALVSEWGSRSETLRLRHQDGSWRYIEATGADLRDDPVVQGLVVNGHDVTERREAEERLYDTLMQLEHELARAAEMQAMLLPQHTPCLPGFDLAARCLPAREVGGDFYDWQEPRAGVLNLTLADVMGKGMGAALLMATARTAMRIAGREDSPGAVIKRVAATLESDLEISGRFITTLMAQLDVATRRLTYVDAGHGLAFVRRANGAVEPLGPRGLPLGVFSTESYIEGSVVLEPGDAFVMYSDGLIDACPELVLNHQAISTRLDGAGNAAEVVARLIDLALIAGPPPDDLTVVVLRCLDQS